jgi:hypothetical protein
MLVNHSSCHSFVSAGQSACPATDFAYSHVGRWLAVRVAGPSIIRGLKDSIFSVQKDG